MWFLWKKDCGSLYIEMYEKYHVSKVIKKEIKT